MRLLSYVRRATTLTGGSHEDAHQPARSSNLARVSQLLYGREYYCAQHGMAATTKRSRIANYVDGPATEIHGGEQI